MKTPIQQAAISIALASSLYLSACVSVEGPSVENSTSARRSTQVDSSLLPSATPHREPLRQRAPAAPQPASIAITGLSNEGAADVRVTVLVGGDDDALRGLEPVVVVHPLRKGPDGNFAYTNAGFVQEIPKSWQSGIPYTITAWCGRAKDPNDVGQRYEIYAFLAKAGQYSADIEVNRRITQSPAGRSPVRTVTRVR